MKKTTMETKCIYYSTNKYLQMLIDKFSTIFHSIEPQKAREIIKKPKRH